jgi:hypothetical protein
MKLLRVFPSATLVVLIGLAPLLGAAEKYVERAAKAEKLPAKIWRDPGDVTRLDLFFGSGGKGHMPDLDATYTFIRNETKGANPKFDVEDRDGVRWRVKLGNEAQSETAATRLVWAAGYFVDEVYFLPEINVSGVPKKFLSPEGKVVGARLERRGKGTKKSGNWDWFANPFDGTRELNGLRVMMALLNNWDVKELNNGIIAVNGERRFLVSDLGTAFGRTGGIGDRTKNDYGDYEAEKFIDSVEPEYVNFVLRSRPPFVVRVFAPGQSRQLSQREKIARHIPRADARWLGERLAKLSDEQILDSFRAGGYAPGLAQRFAAVVRKRIAELNAL